MNKALTFCKTHGYHILGARPTDDWHLSTTILISPTGYVDMGVLTLIEDEKLFAGWEDSRFHAYICRFKGKWIGFVDPLSGETMMKIQAPTIPELKDKILTKFANNESSTLQD